MNALDPGIASTLDVPFTWRLPVEPGTYVNAPILLPGYMVFRGATAAHPYTGVESVRGAP